MPPRRSGGAFLPSAGSGQRLSPSSYGSGASPRANRPSKGAGESPVLRRRSGGSFLPFGRALNNGCPPPPGPRPPKKRLWGKPPCGFVPRKGRRARAGACGEREGFPFVRVLTTAVASS